MTDRFDATTGPSATEAEAVARVVANLMTVQRAVVERGTDTQAAVLAVPRGLRLDSVKPYLDEYLPRPERKSGTSHHTTLDSFIEHVRRHRHPDGTEQSVLFGWVCDDHPKLTCVYDYHEPGPKAAGWLGYRAVYTFPLSQEWRAWASVTNAPMSQEAFAEFLEDRVADVTSPDDAGDAASALIERVGGELASPAQLITLSRGLTVHVGRRVTNTQTLASGEAQIAFEEEHSDDVGRPLRVPAAFQIAVPVFEGGDPWRIAVRLRYRVQGGAITWRLQPYRMPETLRGVMQLACRRAAEETELPLFWGSPE